MPPLSGEYLIPPAVGSIARELGAINVEEYYVVMGADGGILERAPLPSQPKILTLNNAAVFVFRSFYHIDPWARAPRYVVSAEGLSPVSPSLCYWRLPAYNNEHGEYAQIVVYAEGETHIYIDWGANGSLDDSIIISNGVYTITSKDYPSATFAVHVEGLMTCSATYIGAWDFHLDTATERRSTVPILSKVITTTTTPVEMPLQVYVNASTAHVLIPYSSDMWLEIFMGDGPMIGRIAEKYFDKIVEGPTTWHYTSGDWYIAGAEYLATVDGYPQFKLVKHFAAARMGDLVVAVIKYTNVGEEVTLTQWWSHIHEGTDGLEARVVPPGYTFSAEWESQHIDDARALLEETELYIGGQYYGALSEQSLWDSLPPDDVKLIRGSSLVVIKPLNELSTTNQIQLVTNNYWFAGQVLASAQLDFQHAEVTLESGGEAQYVYVITLGREPTQRDIDEAAKILPKLLETPQQTTTTTTKTTTTTPITTTTTVTTTTTTPLTTTTTSPVTITQVTTTTISTPTAYITIHSEYGSLFYRGFNLNNTFFVEINGGEVLNVSGTIDGRYELSFSYNESLGMWESIFNPGVLERGPHILAVNATLTSGSIVAGEYRFYVIDPPPFIRNIIDLGPFANENFSIGFSVEFNVLGSWSYWDKRYEIVIDVDIKWRPFRTNITSTQSEYIDKYVNGSWDFGTIEFEARFALSSDGSMRISGTLYKEFEAEIMSVKINGKGYATVSGSWIIDWGNSSIDLDFLELIIGLSVSGSKTLPTPWGIETPIGSVGVTITISPSISGDLTIIFTPTDNKSEYLFNLLPLKVADVRGDIKGSIIVSGQIGGKFRAGSGAGLYAGVAGILGAGVFLHPFNELMRGGGIVGEVDAFVVIYYIIGKYQRMFTLLGPGLIYSWGNLTADDIETLLELTNRLKDIGGLIDWINGSWSGYIVENYSIGGDYSAAYHGNALYIYYTYTLPNGSSWIKGYKLVDRDLIDLPNPELEALGVASPYLFELDNGSLAMLYAIVPAGAHVSNDLQNLEILLQMCIWNDSSGKWYKPVNITVDGVVFSYISDGKYIYVIYSPSFNYDTTELRKYSLDGKLLYSKPYPGLLYINSVYGDKVYVTAINGSILEITPTSINVLSEARSVGFLRENNLNYILFVNKTLVIYNNTYSSTITLPETAIDAQPLIYNNTIYIICVTSDGIAIYRYTNDLKTTQTYTLLNITSVKTAVGESYLYILAQTIDDINSQTGDLALFIYQPREEQTTTNTTTTTITITSTTTVTTTVTTSIPITITSTYTTYAPTTITTGKTLTTTLAQPTTVTARETIATTTTIRETYATTIPTTITSRETATVTAADWTTTGIVAAILLLIGIAVGYAIKRK